MTTAPDLNVLAEPSWEHASRAAYAAYLARYYDNPRSIRATLNIRDRFVRAYPDLRQWLAAPLTERIGRRAGEPVGLASYKVSFLARTYLIFLGLHGYVRFPWEWLIALPRLDIWPHLTCIGHDLELAALTDEAVRLGYNRCHAIQAIRWTLTRVVLHTGITHMQPLCDTQRRELLEAVVQFRTHPDVAHVFGSLACYDRLVRAHRSHIHLVHVVLFHLGRATAEPHRIMPASVDRTIQPPRMRAVVDRFLATRRLTDRPATIERFDIALRQFVTWLATHDAGIETFADVTRDHLLAFAAALDTMIAGRTGQPFAAWSKLRRMSALSVFFRQIAAWHWDDVPPRPLLGPGDLPKMPNRVPRYIPEDQLARLMVAIRALPCPYQRAALLVARWSGARRNEIRRLSADCLDAYPDGTPRLRIPAGKTKQERLVPLNAEAASAICQLQAQRYGVHGFRDELTGLPTQYLFLQHGKLLSANYLFDAPLTVACQAAGLLTPDGKRAITPHRFRHTVGTQLAERGAKLDTIMRVLGHASPGMSLVYTHISDQAVLADYQSVLAPGALIAGPCAAALRSGALPAAAVDWLKTNFLKTELELGHCLRLPHEGPCECDLYLNCAKFVTTPAYAPRLVRRRERERELIADAAQRGWHREVERHRATVRRIEQLLSDLAEPCSSVEGDELAGAGGGDAGMLGSAT